MRSILRGALVAAACLGTLALGACNPVTTTTSGPPVQTCASGDVTCQVQAAVETACSYVPAAETISAIVASFVANAAPGVNLVASVATAVCAAVTPPTKQSASLKRLKRKFGGAALGLSVGDGTVNGIKVQGYFVR